MEDLEKLDKSLIREFCTLNDLTSVGSKRQLLARIAESNLPEDNILAFVEDTLEKLELLKERESKEREEQVQARELRQLELQLEIEKVKAGNASFSSTESNNQNSKIKMSEYLTPYQLGGDIGMFLTNFERLGEQLEVPQEQWAFQLLRLLPSVVSAVIARMSANDSADYSKVKETLLARYKLNPEAFRQRFRQATRKPDQPYSELGYYLESNLHEWITGSKVDGQFNKLKDLIALEQFYNIIPDSLRYWLLDKNPETLEEACLLSDQYEARREQP